ELRLPRGEEPLGRDAHAGRLVERQRRGGHGGGGGGRAGVAHPRGGGAAGRGSDPGGSVPQPAALCGITGFKPTYGRVSRYGLIAFGSSLDHVSPFARSVRDLELVLSVISGRDARDSTCLDENALLMEHGDVSGLRIGVPKEYFPSVMQGAVRERTEEALERLRNA